MIMKKLIYIDNDNSARAKEDVDYVKGNLTLLGGLSDEYVETIEILPDFAHMDKDKAYDLIFSGGAAICSWSMYTANHYGSLYQLTGFLHTAATSQVMGIIYLDCSGEIEKALTRVLRDDYKFASKILHAIETNYIITLNFEEKCMCRLRLDFKGYWEPMFKHEPIDLNELLTTQPA